MAVLDPEWTESLDTAGRPRDPLGATRARNQVVDVYAHGLITENPFRMRYFSLFPWFLSSLDDGTISTDDQSEDFLIKRFEKLVALSSRYHALFADLPYEAMRAVTGVLRLRRLSLEDLENIELDDFQLQKNDGYGYQNYERALQKLLLKRGGYQLTVAGQEVADTVSPSLAPYEDRIFECVKSGTVTVDDFEDYARPISIHAIHTYPEEFESELSTLQKVLCGVLSWEGDPYEGSTRITQYPDSFDTDFLHYLYDSLPQQMSSEVEDEDSITTDEEQDGVPIESIPFENYNEHLHDIRRSTVLFFLHSWRLYRSDAETIRLSEPELGRFEDIRKLFLLYWLQIYAGFAIDAQLEAVTTYVNKFDPPRFPIEELLSVPDPGVVEDSVADALSSLDTSRIDTSIDPQKFTRHLLLYSEAISNELEVEIGQSSTTVSSMADARKIATAASEAPEILEAVNEVSLAKAIRISLNELSESSPDESSEPWGQALGRSLALLLYIDTRLESLRASDPDLYRLMDYQLGTQPGNSLPYIHQYMQAVDPTDNIAEVGRRIINERVIRVHEDVMYTRLTPGNLQRLLSLDRSNAVCLRVDEDPHTQPFRARPRFIRFDELNTLIRDCNLLTGSQDDGYELTETGVSFLQRVLPEDTTSSGSVKE